MKTTHWIVTNICPGMSRSHYFSTPDPKTLRYLNISNRIGHEAHQTLNGFIWHSIPLDTKLYIDVTIKLPKNGSRRHAKQGI